jgi:basic amino acid/polyamine antiporter, APA family
LRPDGTVQTCGPDTTKPAISTLKGDIGRFQLFAFGFGSIIGSAWCVLVGEWLSVAGPGGAALGFICGGIVIACIGACYAELTARIPVTGGEFSYVLPVFGRSMAFYVGWFVTFAWICVAVFEGLAIAWLFERLAPEVPDINLYTVFGGSVTRNALLIGCTGAPIIAIVNFAGGRLLAGFHSLLTYTFACVAVCVVILMFVYGHAENLSPIFPQVHPVWWQGAARIFGDCAFLLGGFQSISQLVEEKSAHIPFRLVLKILVISIGAASLFYCSVVVGTAVSVPWPDLPAHSLAFVEAARLLPGGSIIVPLVLVVAMISLLKTWNAVFLMAARTIIALVRNGFLPGWLNRWRGPAGIPAPAVLVIFILNVMGLMLGRGAVGMLVDTISISLVFCYAFCCIALAVLRYRTRRAAPCPVRVPVTVLAIGIIGSVVMACAAVAVPLIQAQGVPVTYLIFPGWAVIGTITLLLVRRQSIPRT